MPPGYAGGNTYKALRIVWCFASFPPSGSGAEQRCVYTGVTWHVLWEWIHFLLQPVCCWHLASCENSQLSSSSSLLPPSSSNCCSVCQGSPLHYELIIAPLASLLSEVGSNRVIITIIAVYYWAIREDDLPPLLGNHTFNELSYSGFVFLAVRWEISLNVMRLPTHSDRQTTV